MEKARNTHARRTTLVIGLSILLTVTTFLVDLRLPVGYAVSIMYLFLVPLGLWLPYLGYPLVAAAVASLLTVIDVLISPWGDDLPDALVNRPVILAVLWGTAIHVYRHKNVELHLERESHSLRATLKALADLKYALDQSAIVATTDRRGLITYANDKFCEISKYSRDELLGQDHRIINSGGHSKDFFRTMWHTIASGRVWRGEIRNRAKDGSHYWVDTTIVPFLDDQGRPYQYMAIRSDITERKRAEEQIQEQAALTRLGQMAAVVAHEVKNPLAGLRGALQVIGSRLPQSATEVQIIREMLARIDALNHLIQDLLLFARPRQPKMGPVELGPLLRDTAALLTKDPAHAGLQIDITGPEAAVSADADMIRAVLFNLMLNAAQAMEGSGHIQVAIDRLDGVCQIAICDRGPGIPPDVREHIFEPFFTTRHRGTGLGLPIAKRAVELHGGSLSLEQPSDGGTRVLVRLPAPAQAGQEPKA